MATVVTRDPAAKPRVSVDEYLDRELAEDRAGGPRAEYANGEVREMSGASEEHNLICWNVGSVLRTIFRGKPLVAYPSHMRVRVAAEGPFYYPDIAIARSPARILKDRGSTLLDPVAVFEVLSSSTERIDRGEKLESYGRIASITDYVLIAQDEPRVDHYSRQPDGSWRLVILKDLAEALSLPSIGVDLPLAEVYDRVFPAGPAS